MRKKIVYPDFVYWGKTQIVSGRVQLQIWAAAEGVIPEFSQASGPFTEQTLWKVRF